jgi:type I restriction enzyme S subunit
LVEVQSGSGFPTKFQGRSGEALPFYKVSDMNLEGNTTLMVNETNSISQEVRKSLGATIFPKGSIIFPKIGGAIATNKKRLTTCDCCVDNNVMGVIPDPTKIESEFLYYFFIQHNLTDFANEAHLPSIRKTTVEAWPIQAPRSLGEQNRIVAILDEAFAALTTAKANAEKNIQNARGLFESYLDRTLAKGGDGWAHRLLGDIADNVSTGPFGTMLHKSDYVPHGIPLINPMCLVNSRIVPSDRMMVSEKTRSRLRSYVLRVGDVVIGRRGDLGRCAVVTKAEEGWLCGTGSFFVRLSPCIDQEYFAACFRSRKSKGWLEEQCVGTTMQNLNHQILARLPILLPPIVTQRAIMARGKRLNECVARLIHNFDQKLFALEELKKSLLNEAFNGRL